MGSQVKQAASSPYREAPPAAPVRRDWVKIVKPTAAVLWVGVVFAVTYSFIGWAVTDDDEIPVQIEHGEKSDVVRVRVYDVWGQAEHLDTYATCSGKLSQRFQDRCREVGWAP